MTNTFDPATHRFGMAYRTEWDDDIFHPIINEGELQWFPNGEYDGLSLEDARKHVIRAPEHDLIPRPPVSPEDVRAITDEVMNEINFDLDCRATKTVEAVALQVIKLFVKKLNKCTLLDFHSQETK